MSKIQDEASKIVQAARKEQRRIEELTSDILKEKDANISSIIRETEEKNQKAFDIASRKQQEMEMFIEQQRQNYTDEELNYVNSINYENYKYTIERLDNVLPSIIAQIRYYYEQNMMFYKDAFHTALQENFMISEIGFPIPERFLQNLKQTIESKLQLYNQFEDGIYEVNVMPVEYINQSNNIVKKIDSYQVDISLIKEKTDLKPKKR